VDFIVMTHSESLKRIENLELGNRFINALAKIAKLPQKSYFLYGSSALSVIFKDPTFSDKKIRFKNLPALRDIDIAVFPEIGWDQIIEIQQEVYAVSGGEYSLDAHSVPNAGNEDLCSIKGVTIPRSWLTYSIIEYYGLKISILDPIPTLMLRLLHGEPRIRDTKRIMKELSLLKSYSELNDERILFAFKKIMEKPKPGKILMRGSARLVFGILPPPLIERVRSMYRKKYVDQHLGESMIRTNPENL
jgi:hypothetical protein